MSQEYPILNPGQQVKCLDDGLIYTVKYQRPCGKVAVQIVVGYERIAKFVWRSRLEVVDDSQSSKSES